MSRMILLLPLFIMVFSCGSSTDSTSPQTLRFCQTAPAIISRQEWNARAPTAEMDTLVPIRFIIHHSGVLQTPNIWVGEQMSAIQDYHMDFLGSPDILYHYYIDTYSNIAEGREVRFEINRLLYDSGETIHIALEGNFEIELMTTEQLESLDQMLCWLSDTYGIAPIETYGHRDFFETLCPGEALYLDIENIVARVEELLLQ